MDLLNRAQAPEFKEVEAVNVPAVASALLDNGQSIYWINAGQQPIVRMEVIFEAGAWYEPMPGISSMTMKMLTEGTQSRTSAQISAHLDQYGAFVEPHSGTDRTSLTVYCLAKYLPVVLPLIREMLSDSVIPENELAHQKNITLQNLRINLEKTNYVAGTLIREKLLGKQHPYTQHQQIETVEAIQREMILTHYQQRIQHRPFRILLAGKLSETEIALINQHLGQQPVSPPTPPDRVGVQATTDFAPTLIEKEGSLQSSIRLGRMLFTRQHPDYFPMLVLNEVLGGYFGSRLMKNIREEKGFTYGIWSSVSAFPREGYLTIGTDVKREFTQQTLDEIWKEIRQLRNEPVPADELETVINYMAGSYVGSLNTPFEIADRYKSILFDGLSNDYLNTYIQNLRAVTAEQLVEMANRYFQDGALTEVVVGGK